ncbi:MAG TPA: diguanylate cyclase, partial [Anaerolineales bacterium]|nr:diguanylate cyclase [Anaerolineales bacterium]
MKNQLGFANFKPQEKQIPVVPAGIASILLLVFMMLNGIANPSANPMQDATLVLYCVINSFYLTYFYFILVPSPRFSIVHVWIFAVIEIIASTTIIALLPNRIDTYLSGLMILLAITASIVSERKIAYFITAGMTISSLILNITQMNSVTALLSLVGSTFIAVVAIETIYQLKSITRRNINRLEIINEFSRQITSSLDTEQVLSLLNAAIQNALEADSYFVGIAEGDKIRLVMLYDDGEYFTDVLTQLDGSLSGWVIKNQKELFLTDLRRDLKLAGVEDVIVGKNRTSLSWVGVPLKGLSINGLIAIASYHPNAFDRSDLELMNNMARHAALALDNTIQHGKVEMRSRLDSLTKVYNHGYFLKLLKQQAEDALSAHGPLSLIMLDIDYFKQYNDTYGHLAGDEILVILCDTIRDHIKGSDVVGRWGGEEFVISLPGANGKQAQQVANRIHQSMKSVNLKDRNQ